jgi:hypothetical protein
LGEEFTANWEVVEPPKTIKEKWEVTIHFLLMESQQAKLPIESLDFIAMCS